MRDVAPKKPRKNDDFLKLTLVQLALCALLFAVIFIAMKMNGDLFTRLQAEFSALTAEDCNLRDVTFFPPAEDETAAAAVSDETAAGFAEFTL